MTRREGTLLSSLLMILMLSAATSFTANSAAFATLPPKKASLSSFATRQSTFHHHAAKSFFPVAATPLRSSVLHLAQSDEEFGSSPKIYTPLDRPLLAVIDTISLTIFAAIGKSSHSDDGSLDLVAVLVTAFPFITAWLATSPLTGVYSPDDRDNNIAVSTGLKVAKGWILAVPLGIVLRGVIKGYAPPVPFVIVTLISTLVILAGVRILFSVVEDFFVELVN
eukprot:CAMPEP_0183730088 /NCGR_PEP_ID=MMETSP0737-20130205/31945_1 /TAXON_ID=385413 /ORGANISM="Thalassiosira miniscula, Strain CCMP1093" /LENGTH=222 /DNA_ID=CAMNT_0025962475 /DNA_START=25 /DNA_END=693 /DNA_ORIENTATION=+